MMKIWRKDKMKNKVNYRDYLFTGLGLFLVALGIYLVRIVGISDKLPLTFSYLSIGIGCGIFGHGIGNLLLYRSTNSFEIQKQIAIARKDERNLMIMYRAKAKAYDFMSYLFMALIIALTLSGVDITTLLLLILAYLLVQGYGVFYRIKFDREL